MPYLHISSFLRVPKIPSIILHVVEQQIYHGWVPYFFCSFFVFVSALHTVAQNGIPQFRGFLHLQGIVHSKSEHHRFRPPSERLHQENERLSRRRKTLFSDLQRIYKCVEQCLYSSKQRSRFYKIHAIKYLALRLC